MNVKTLTATILRRIPGIGKCQHKFFLHLVLLHLSLRTRYNFMSMSRYGYYSEQSYRLNYGKEFPFAKFNEELIQEYCGSDKVLLFDPSHLNKSGKHTPGVGYFWSGCAGAMKWGMELCGIAVADMENHTAMHYQATQTENIKGEESLREYYAKIITEQREGLHRISKNIVVDAFFSKKSFIDPICGAGFVVTSRLPKNVYLRYRYQGERHQGKGRPKEFDGKIDINHVSTDHFTILTQSEEEIIYQGEAHVRSLQRWCKIVIVHPLKEGKKTKALVYLSTDINMSGQRVIDLYRMRFQIEYLYRDAKQHLGMTHCQSRQKDALNYHFNATLTTLNLAKVQHWLSIPKETRGAFSMADIKTQYINELLLDKLISIYGKDPYLEKNNPEILKLYQLGAIAA